MCRIRKWKENDLDYLQNQDMLASLEVQYHGDTIKDEVYTAVDGKDRAVGVLYFKYHYTWKSKGGNYRRIVPCICTEKDDRYDELLDYAVLWLKKQKEHVVAEGTNQILWAYDDTFMQKKATKEDLDQICLGSWEDATEITELQKYMSKGFLENEVCPVLRFDVTKTIPEYSIPEGFHIEKLAFEPDAVQKYIIATEEANDGVPDSIHDIWFMSNEPSFHVYILKEGEEIVGCTSCWKITEERAAIENISVVPKYRRRNMAKTIITHTLNEIRNQGYSYATLSMQGQNRKAHFLYQSLGFELMYNQIALICI